jgi:hypothetical protein
MLHAKTRQTASYLADYFLAVDDSSRAAFVVVHDAAEHHGLTGASRQHE